VEAACTGDIDSFRELYKRHYSMAVGIARSRLSISTWRKMLRRKLSRSPVVGFIRFKMVRGFRNG
jgi:hypothetical protein